MFDQTAPEVLAEVRQLAWQGFQRRDEPLELSPADAALPDFRRKGVPLCQEDSNHRISGGCKVFTLQDNSHEALVTPEVWKAAQYELKRREGFMESHGICKIVSQAGSGFSGKVYCGLCGSSYHRLNPNGNTPYWKCLNAEKAQGKICTNGNVKEKRTAQSFHDRMEQHRGES